MSLIFPKWMNHLPTLLAVVGGGGATTAIAGFWYYATPKFYEAGYMPTQPGGGFSHQIHAGKLGMDCRYCHTKIETSAEANIPNVATCAGCHTDGKLTKLAESDTHKKRTEFIREAYAKDASVEWRRVHKVPDYVRNFPHQIHLNRGISCYSCHGRIDTMPVVFQKEPLSMSWCLDCHRNPEPHILADADRWKFTDLQWVEGELKKRTESGEAGAASLKSAQDTIKLRHIQAPENCGACHY